MSDLPDKLESTINAWLDDPSSCSPKRLSGGYQGSIWLFEHEDIRYVVKVATHSRYFKSLLAFTLRHEHRVYQKLAGIKGIPQCYGFFQNRCLVLEFIEGQTLRRQQPEDPDRFYQSLFNIIQQLHQRGIAHADLKKKDNILVTAEGEPCLVDFGAAVVMRKGFRPVNTYLFHLAKRFDLNAWIKHKYKRRYENVSAEDAPYLQRTLIERFAAAIKRYYRRLFTA